MFFRIIAAAAFLSLASACTYWEKEKLVYDHQSGWARQIRERASEAYAYAQMSYNAYVDGELYDLGPDYSNPQNEENDEIGFAYSVFERRQAGRLAEVVIAFRGTELKDAKDIVEGDLKGSQNAAGLAVYKIIRGATDPSVPVNVTGHSLGGGIATQVSLRYANVKTYVFNSSPRFWKKGDIPENRRLSIVERGELLKVFRAPAREAPQTYVSINCTPGFDPIEQHRSRALADCLTQIAAWQDPVAKDSMRRNPSIKWPDGLPRN
jgi:hypothetical protein